MNMNIWDEEESACEDEERAAREKDPKDTKWDLPANEMRDTKETSGEPEAREIVVCTSCAREASADEHGCCDVCGENRIYSIFLKSAALAPAAPIEPYPAKAKDMVPGTWYGPAAPEGEPTEEYYRGLQDGEDYWKGFREGSKQAVDVFARTVEGEPVGTVIIGRTWGGHQTSQFFPIADLPIGKWFVYDSGPTHPSEGEQAKK